MDNGKNNAGSILITVGKETHKEKQRRRNTKKKWHKKREKNIQNSSITKKKRVKETRAKKIHSHIPSNKN